MHHFLPIAVILLLAACGMKGDLYETPPAGGATEAAGPGSEPATGETDKGERRTIPSAPDPDRSE